MSAESGGLLRSRREIDAARVLCASGFADQAISRAYFAAFYAAEACLHSLGITRSKHSGVISTFAKDVVAAGLPADVGRLLRSLFERRNAADYGSEEASEKRARDATDDAEHFVEAAEVWLARHGSTT